MSLFGDEANALMHDHVDEFMISDDNVITHTTCSWTYRAPTTIGVWEIRGTILRHLRSAHAE